MVDGERVPGSRKYRLSSGWHLDGIINAIVLRATNASAESINSRIQKVKRMSHGFRSRERFRNVIYFHLDGMELHA